MPKQTLPLTTNEKAAAYDSAVAKAEDQSGLSYCGMRWIADRLREPASFEKSERDTARQSGAVLLQSLWETLVGECICHQSTIETWAWETKELDAYHEAEVRAESPEWEQKVRADLLIAAEQLREAAEDRGVESRCAGYCEVAESHIGMLRRLLADARAAIPEGCESVECEECVGLGKHEIGFGMFRDCPDCDGTGKRLRKKEVSECSDA